MKTLEEIMTKLKEGESLLVGTCLYEENISYENGEFVSWFENGMDCVTNKRSEKYVERTIIEALNKPDEHDLYIGDYDVLNDIDYSEEE